MLWVPDFAETSLPTIKQLTIADLTEGCLDSFIRYQETTRVRYVTDAGYSEKATYFTDDWDTAKRSQLVALFRDCVRRGGAVFGAVEDGQIVALMNVAPERFGSKAQYVELQYLHVSADRRGGGLGKALFGAALQAAQGLGATKLYISTHPAVESQAFYDAMGCVPAAEVKSYPDGEESDAIQLEVVLG